MNTPDHQRRPSPNVPQPGAATGVAAPATALSAADESRARAAQRAAALREHNQGDMDDGVDKFYVDPRTIPDGWSYEWKMLTVLGKQDPSYQVNLSRTGWEAVPRSRHPELMPDTYRGETIERDGQILMERPKEITDEVKARELRKARDQVRGKEAQLGAAPQGQFERGTHPVTQPRINKTFESIPIPKE